MKRFIAYLVLPALTIYTAIIYNSTAMIFLAGVEFFLPLFLFLILFLQVLRLQLRPPESGRFFEQEERRSLAFSIENRTVFPIRRISIQMNIHNLTAGEKKKQRLTASLNRGENRLPLEEASLRPGIYRVSVKKIRVFDFWKLWSLPKRPTADWEFIQLPRRHEISVVRGPEALGLSWESQEYHPHKSGNDSSYIREIREYRPGDSLKQIHWKLSAKKDALLVKEYGQPLSCDLLLGLSGKTLSPEMTELVYSLLISLCHARQSVLLIWRCAVEQEPCLLPVFSEEDVCLAMEQLFRKNITQWGEQLKPELPACQFWLTDGKLMKNEEVAVDFSHGKLEELFTDMELML